MSKNAKDRKVKDLDPKAGAKDVKGGFLCLLGVPFRALENLKGTVRKVPNPR